jgi:hypothetical protein
MVKNRRTGAPALRAYKNKFVIIFITITRRQTIKFSLKIATIQNGLYMTL